MRRLLPFVLAAAPLAAQQEKFELRQLTVNVADQVHRALGGEGEQAWLGVRLAEQQDPRLEPNTQIGTIERTYTTGDTAYQKFTISDGVSRPIFVVYKDENLQVNYEVVGLVREPGRNTDRVVKLDKGIWPVSKLSTAVIDVRTPDYQAPVRTTEILYGFLFGLAALLLIYSTFARELFRRYLFNRRWRVGKAENWSNILTILWVLLLVVVLWVLRYSPNWWPGDYVYSCLLAMGAYIIALLLFFSICVLATGRR